MDRKELCVNHFILCDPVALSAISKAKYLVFIPVKINLSSVYLFYRFLGGVHYRRSELIHFKSVAYSEFHTHANVRPGSSFSESAVVVCSHVFSLDSFRSSGTSIWISIQRHLHSTCKLNTISDHFSTITLSNYKS